MARFWKLTSATAAFLAALATSSWAQSTAQPIPIRIGIQAQTSWLLYTAKELHIFEKVGLAPTFIKLTTGAQAIPAMQSRSVDIASPGITPFTAGRAQGVNWIAIGIDTENAKGEGFLARKDTNIKTLKDLRGKTVGVARGSTSYYALLAALKKNGINKGDFKLLEMGPPEQLAALMNKNVDAVAVWDPWIARMRAEAGARLIGMEADYGIYTAVAVLAAHGEFLKENPEATKRFLRAMLMAYDQIQKNGPGAAVEAMASAMGITKDLAKKMYEQTGASNPYRWADSDYLYSLTKDGKFAKNAQEMADFMLDEHLITKKVDIASAFDSSYIAEVLKTYKK